MLKTPPAHLFALATALLLGACGPEAPEPASPRSTSEGQTWQPLTFNDHDYLFVRSARTWWDAKAICESLGYGLVTVNDASEERWLDGFQGPHTWWLGHNDTQSEGSWRWSHGASSYTNWLSGEPNNAGNNEDCAHDNWLGRGGWNDYPCDIGQYFICESLQ
ncbi:MAG TPA: C-type lectin domain-containing protein [Archangium sp.]|jgi:hypothetical protein|uniref:C-type lectin domain-containing protein n=1 Tax=Archangium sp. TaxID=1872627 RepID=UPI002EDBB0AC